MQCIRPIKAGFTRTGDITYSIKKISKELASFEFPCRKCLACRLNIAREKAIRCVHESKVHKKNMFLTLTYDPAHLPADGRLNYLDFQLFMKSLREKVSRGLTSEDAKKAVHISYMVTGEYGEKNKRPHWHAIIFNYEPNDKKYKYTTDLDETVFISDELTSLWGKGAVEFGSVTMDSAGYVARYAAKKLVHGSDSDHEYHPIHKTSSKHAVGKRWIEKYYKDVLAKGYIVLPNGQSAGIPRYYIDWIKKHHMDEYIDFYNRVKIDSIMLAENKARADELEFISQCLAQDPNCAVPPLRKKQVTMTILKQKFKQLQERLKL